MSKMTKDGYIEETGFFTKDQMKMLANASKQKKTSSSSKKSGTTKKK